MAVQYIDEYLKTVRSFQLQLDQGQYNINACQLGEPALKIRKVLSSVEKDSASSTIICFGVIGSQDVAVKIAFQSNPKEGGTNELEVEQDIYEYLVPKMLKHTPHLLGIQYIAHCQKHWNPSKILPRGIQGRNSIPSELEKETELIAKEYGKEFDTTTATFLITELAPSSNDKKTFYEFITSPDIKKTTNKFYIPIIAQIAWTLLVFQTFGLVHHDLHLGNVFIDELKVPVEIIYNIYGRKYRLVTKYFVRIYDFDHSTVVKSSINSRSISNTLLTKQFCDYYGKCNEYEYNLDWFTLIIKIARTTYDTNTKTSGPEWREWLEDIIPRNIILDQINNSVDDDDKNQDKKGKWASLGYVCECQDQKCKICKKRHDVLKNIRSPFWFIHAHLPHVDTHADFSLE